MKKYGAYVTFFVPFFVYLSTTCSDVTFFDSGELIAASYTFGIAHPPGYPLYVILSHFFKYLPFGNAAFKVVLFSALCGSTSSYITYLITKKLLKKENYAEMIAAVAGLIFAFSYTPWSQSVATEVYTLSTTCIAFSILLAVLYIENKDKRFLIALCFFASISIVAHLTALVLLVIIVFIVFYVDRRDLLNMKFIMLGLFFFFFGLSVLLHLPFRAWQDKALLWGDPKNLSQFLWVILREGYNIEGPERTFSLFIRQMSSFNLIREFGFIPLVLGIVGFFLGFRKYFYFTIMAAIIFVILNVGVVIYGNPIPENIFLLESFHSPGYLFFAIFSAIGIGELTYLWTLITESRKVVLFILSFITVVYLIYYNYENNDWSNYHIARDYGKNVLKSCERNSVLFTWGDSGAFPLWYLQKVENYRKDVILLHTPHLDAYWYWNEPDKIGLLEKPKLRIIWQSNEGPDWMVRYLVRQLINKMSVHLDYSTKYSVMLPGMNFIPDGIIYSFSENSRPSRYELFDFYTMRDLKNFNELKDLDTEKAISIYGYCLFDNGVNLFMYDKKKGKDLIMKAVDILPSLKFQAMTILGEIK